MLIELSNQVSILGLLQIVDSIASLRALKFTIHGIGDDVEVWHVSREVMWTLGVVLGTKGSTGVLFSTSGQIRWLCNVVIISHKPLCFIGRSHREASQPAYLLILHAPHFAGIDIRNVVTCVLGSINYVL